MLTRGAAGPPDVPIPTRLVTSGPLLLSLQYTQTHTPTPTHKGFLQQTKHSTCTATQNGKLLYAGAIVDLHTMRILFKECHSDEHVNTPGLNDKAFFFPPTVF